jgi:hypothetical protein
MANGHRLYYSGRAALSQRRIVIHSPSGMFAGKQSDQGSERIVIGCPDLGYDQHVNLLLHLLLPRLSRPGEGQCQCLRSVVGRIFWQNKSMNVAPDQSGGERPGVAPVS